MDFTIELPDLINTETVNAADFGFAINSADNTNSLNSAIFYCKNHGNSILEISHGIYYFNHTDPIRITEMGCIPENRTFQPIRLPGQLVFNSIGEWRVFHEKTTIIIDVI